MHHLGSTPTPETQPTKSEIRTPEPSSVPASVPAPAKQQKIEPVEPPQAEKPKPQNDEKSLWAEAKSMISAKRMQAAKIVLEQLLKLNPYHLDGLIAIGTILNNASKFDRAKDYWARAKKINENHPRVLVGYHILFLH